MIEQLKTAPENIGRRDFLRQTGALIVRIGIGSALMNAANAKEAEAGSEFEYNAFKYDSHAEVVNNFRRVFGRRQDYQQGFEAAMGQTGFIYELPEGMYGILPEKINARRPRVITPGTEMPVEKAAYLHVSESFDQRASYSLSTQLNLAGIELNNAIETIVFSRYPDYDRRVFARVRLPVVTMNNLDTRQVEQFLRFPIPGTMEYFQMANGSWADYYDQGKLRHEHPFMAYFSKSRSLYQNLQAMYGPQFQVLSQASKKTKFLIGATISAMNNGTHGITKAFFGARGAPASFILTPQEKAGLNQWLGLSGTPHEIR